MGGGGPTAPLTDGPGAPAAGEIGEHARSGGERGAGLIGGWPGLGRGQIRAWFASSTITLRLICSMVASFQVRLATNFVVVCHHSSLSERMWDS